MQRFFLSAFAVALCSTAPFAAECPRELLTPNVTIDIADRKHVRFLTEAMCMMNFEEFKNSFGGEIGTKFLAASFDSNKYEQKKSTKCTNKDEKELKSSFLFSLSSIVPDRAREIMANCVKNSGVYCELHESDNVPSLMIHYNSISIGASHIYDLQNQNVNIKTKLREGKRINEGKTPIVLNVVDPEKGAKVIVTVEQNGGNDSCVAYIPPRRVCTQSREDIVEKEYNVQATFGGEFGTANPLIVNLGQIMDISEITVSARDANCPRCGGTADAGLRVSLNDQLIGFKDVPARQAKMLFKVPNDVVARGDIIKIESLHKRLYSGGEESYISWMSLLTKSKTVVDCE